MQHALDPARFEIGPERARAEESAAETGRALDELREHQTWDAWNAATNTQNAVPDAQAFAISNQGDDTSVVLDALHALRDDFLAERMRHRDDGAGQRAVLGAATAGLSGG